MRAKHHPAVKPRGVRDPRKCMVQAGGTLAWIRTAPGVHGIEEPTPEFWTDRPVKFPAHIRLLLRRPPGVLIEDIRWRQLGSQTWWRLPEWPDGVARREGE